MLALTAPDETAHDFARFPGKPLPVGGSWFRQPHDRASVDRGAWHFSSYPAGAEGAGRFDLEEPDGTCYLASTRRAALNELLGPDHTGRGWVDAALLEGRVVSQLPLPAPVRAAATTTARAADFGLTNEIATTDRYDITQAWAEAWNRAGFDGVYAVLRFSPGNARGLALFGEAGTPSPPPPGDPDPPPVRALVESYGIQVVDPPALPAVTLVSP